MRLDRGTENCKLAECQVFLHRNHRDALAGIRSVTYRKSKLNQVYSKIEQMFYIVLSQNDHEVHTHCSFPFKTVFNIPSDTLLSQRNFEQM